MKEATPTPTSVQNNKRIAKNTLMLYFRMTLTMLVSLYTSRVILNTLGVEDFGIYNVVGGVVTSLSFFNSAMSSATQRFLSFEIGRGDFVQLKKTFNATQIIHIGVAILIFILAETIGLWFVKTHLVIPTERLTAAIWIYHFSVFSFIVSIIQTPYNATLIAHERMSVYAYVSILEVTLKLLIVFMLIWMSFDKLKLYGILTFAVSFIIAAIYRIYTRKNFKESKFEIVIDKELYKTLISYSGWNLFGSIANITKNQGITIIINIFFGPILNASRGIANQVLNAVTTFVSNFQLSFNPQIIKSYSNGNWNYMHKLIFKGSKFSFFLIFYITFPILLKTEDILVLWLKIVPEYAVLFVKLVLINTILDSFTNLFGVGLQATGKIKTYQFIIGTFQLLNLPLTYILYNLGYSVETTYYLSIIMTCLSAITRFLIIIPKIRVSFKDYLSSVIVPILLVTISSLLLTWLVVRIFNNNLLFVIIVSFITTTLFIFVLGLTSNEKMRIKKVIKKIVLRNTRI